MLTTEPQHAQMCCRQQDLSLPVTSCCASTALLTCCASSTETALTHRLMLNTGVMDLEASEVQHENCRCSTVDNAPIMYANETYSPTLPGYAGNACQHTALQATPITAAKLTTAPAVLAAGSKLTIRHKVSSVLLSCITSNRAASPQLRTGQATRRVSGRAA
jgi:hypothetical protein